MKTIRALWFKPSPRTLNTHRTRHTTCLLGGKSPVFRVQWATGGAGTPQFKWQGLSNGKKINPGPLKFLGLQTKPKELPGPKFNPQKTPVPSHKNFQEALNDITIMNLQIVFSIPKQSLLKSNYPKNICQNFPIQTNPEIENFQKKSFDHPCPAGYREYSPFPSPLGLRARFSALENL